MKPAWGRPENKRHSVIEEASDDCKGGFEKSQRLVDAARNFGKRSEVSATPARSVVSINARLIVFLVCPSELVPPLKSGCSHFRNRVILLAASARNADGADDLTVFLQRNATRENHHFAVIRGVNAKKLVTRLTVFR